jgi:hypothetical protein
MTGAMRGACALVLLAAALAATPETASAQRDWNRMDDTLEGAVGLHYGKLGGHGLSFRVPLEWWLYLQASGGIWHTDDKKKHNIGAELNYLLRQDDRVRIYVAGGVSYFYRRELVGSGPGGDQFETRKDWNVGAGVGLEILQGSRWSWMVEADFVHDGRTDDIKVAPQAGIYFYW